MFISGSLRENTERVYDRRDLSRTTHVMPRCPDTDLHSAKEFLFSSKPAAKIAQTVERFRCKLCNKLNGQKSALERHMLTHTGEKSYICQFCRKAFTISSSLYRHIRNMHDPNFVPK